MKKKVVAVIVVVAVLVAFLFSFAKTLTKSVKAGECTITCEKCYLPDRSVGRED